MPFCRDDTKFSLKISTDVLCWQNFMNACDAVVGDCAQSLSTTVVISSVVAASTTVPRRLNTSTPRVLPCPLCLYSTSPQHLSTTCSSLPTLPLFYIASTPQHQVFFVASSTTVPCRLNTSAPRVLRAPCRPTGLGVGCHGATGTPVGGSRRPRLQGTSMHLSQSARCSTAQRLTLPGTVVLVVVVVVVTAVVVRFFIENIDKHKVHCRLQTCSARDVVNAWLIGPRLMVVGTL